MNQPHCRSDLRAGEKSVWTAQVCDLLVDPSLHGFRFVFQPLLDLGSLEGGDMKLIVELFQCFLLASDDFAIESRLLPIAI